ncbi:MAG: chemotaxis protein CheA [Desulfovibrionales bacterium]
MHEHQPGHEVFLEEARELLQELEAALLELEEEPADKNLIDRTFRALHTIKGSGAMFGYDAVSAFTHEVETVFDLVRNGEMSVSRELLTQTLAARDHIEKLLNDPDAAVSRSAQGQELLDQLRALRPDLPEDFDLPEKRQEVPTPGSDRHRIFRIRFEPLPTIFLRGTNPVHLLDELREMGRATIVANIEKVPPLHDLNPEYCYTSWDIILDTAHDENAIRDVFIFVDDECRLEITMVDSGDGDDCEGTYKKLGEILVERGDISLRQIEQVVSEQKRIGNLLQDAGLVSRERIASALAEQTAVRESRKSRQQSSEGSSIRVAAEKLDSLVNLVGELVIVQAQITQMVNERKDPLLVGLSEELERLSNELRDSTLNIRMIPMGTTFGKFKRLVRDLSTELEKEIDLVTQGAETELDKTVIEKLGDPLVHLLRNSIDHGIEKPEVRVSRGKPARGRILLAAEHSGGSVVIRIEDDGAGLDPDRIRKKAVERGLIAPGADKSDQELFECILQPGFSTAESVTNLSGRGVGMDVVKRSIEGLGGSLGIASTKGQGTTVTVKIPLTLAIIEGLQVQVGDEFFVMPLSIVEECVEIRDKGRNGQQLVELRGDLVPYVRLRECFGVPGGAPAIEQVVVTGTDGNRLGIVVDHVIGEHQTVIKSMGKLYSDVPGISGATIKGDGSMALILDVPALLKSVLREEA